MARYTRQTVTSLAGINSELTKIQTALADTLSRKGDTPNQMEGTLDANSNRILNLPTPVSDHEPTPYGLGRELTERAEAAAKQAEASELAAEQAAAIAVQYPEGQLAVALAAPDSTVPVGGVAAGKLASGTTFLNIMDFIPQSEWAAILNYTSTYDASDAIQAAMNRDGYVHIAFPQGLFRVTKTLNIATQVTLTGVDGGSQSMQHTRIYHDPVSTGPLFDVTTLVSGVCIKNFYISGGNGSTCIVSAIPHVRYEFLYWSEYNGGAIQLRPDFTIGSSSLRIKDCEWVGINEPTSHIAYEINCNGGDVHLEGLVAIRGAIGIDVKQGQTVRIVACSVNKQSTYNNFSSLPDSQTAGIRLSGSGYKEAVIIEGCYVEACTNGIYVEQCQSLSIKDNFIQDVGVSGVVGTWERYGNHAINILGTNCQNVSIENNFLRAESNGKSGVDTYYAVNVGASAENINYINNIVLTPGDVSAHYHFSSKVNWIGNKHTASSNPRDSVGASFVNEIDRPVKAFARFTGTSVISDTNYYGIVSVTRNAAGDYTIVTKNPYPSAAITLTAENGAVQSIFFSSVTQIDDFTFNIKTGTSGTALADARQINFSVLG